MQYNSIFRKICPLLNKDHRTLCAVVFQVTDNYFVTLMLAVAVLPAAS
jgi:hypothetical protein